MLDRNNIDSQKTVLDSLPDQLPAQLQPLAEGAINTVTQVTNQVLSINGVIEVIAIVLTGALAWLLAKPTRGLVGRLWPASDWPRSQRAREVVQGLLQPIWWAVGLWLSIALIRSNGFEPNLTTVAASLLNAWIVIRLVTSFVSDQGLAKLFATIAWVVAALNIFGWLKPTINMLDSIGFQMGETNLSVFLILKGLGLAMLFIWVASVTSSLVQSRLARSTRFTPSVRALMGQGARLSLLFLAVMLSLNAIGVDLTALAVFSGAIGVGIGFGLQSIFSNLMAGIIMLFEHTIKVGDFIEFDNGLVGEVREINIRATLVTTNDNVDILVPNSEFINNRVTNWTLRESNRRLRVSFGVAYGTDKELVKRAALEAAETLPQHMLTGEKARPPQVWLTGFGDSSLDFQLVVWLKKDAVKRPGAVMADFNWALESALGKHNIEIPFPQRDLHIRSGELPVQIGKDD